MFNEIRPDEGWRKFQQRKRRNEKIAFALYVPFVCLFYLFLSTLYLSL